MWMRAKGAALAALLAFGAASASAAPPLTLIQDTLYRADGTPFVGTAVVSWSSFVASDGTSIPQGSLSVQVISGLIRVRLVPGTTAAPFTYYTVKFVTGGSTLLTDVWAVPPSASALEVRNVRVSSTTGGGTTPPVTEAIQIGDVQGLEAELSARVIRSPLMQVNRAAVIDSNGQLTSVAGGAADCVRADGTTGPCGTSGGESSLPLMVDAETPSGVVDGINTVFTLNYAPSPADSLRLYRNGILLSTGVDYNHSGNTITFLSVARPEAGDVLQASYRAPAP
jgi:hypothetical protein